MWNAQLDESQAGLKIAGRHTNNLRYADDTTLMAESEEELKSLLMTVKEESEKAVLKLNIQKPRNMASGPITSWQTDWKSGSGDRLYFFGSKITMDGACSHEIKRRLLLGRKTMTNLDSTLKSRDITFLAKVSIVKAMAFPAVTYGCESRNIKKAECWRTDASELWGWRRLLRVPWAARRSNQSILKEINPEYSLEGLMLKLKLQYFGHLMWRADSLGKTLMLGKIDGQRKRERQRMRWLDSITDPVDVNLSTCGEIVDHKEPGVLQATCAVCSGACRVQLCMTPWTVACPAPLSIGFPKQEYWVVVISYSRGSSQPKNRAWVSCVSCTGSWILYRWGHQESLSDWSTTNG